MSDPREIDWKERRRNREYWLGRQKVQELMALVHRDRLLHLAIVVGGMAQWRKRCRKAFAGFKLSDEAIETLYEVFKESAGENPKEQLDAILKSGLVNLKLDRMRGLARFIRDTEHLDEVLGKHVADPDERAAIRAVMINMIPQGTHE